MVSVRLAISETPISTVSVVVISVFQRLRGRRVATSHTGYRARLWVIQVKCKQKK